MSISLARCRHFHTLPVESYPYGEHVADICADCLAQLPIGFGCCDCEWEVIYDWQHTNAIAVVRTEACLQHG